MNNEKQTYQIQTSKRCGNSAHLFMSKKTIGQPFLILDGQYKELLITLLKELEGATAPKLKDVLTQKELSDIRMTLLKELRIKPTGFASAFKYGALHDLAHHLGDCNDPADLHSILGRIPDIRIRTKIRKAYHL